jgi:hypothetical protein
MRIQIVLAFVFLISFSTNSFSQQVEQPQDSSVYALVYIKCYYGYKIQIYYEDGKVEDYTKENGLDPACDFAANSLILIKAFRYMESKGYKLISSASTPYNRSEHMEYIFRKD